MDYFSFIIYIHVPLYTKILILFDDIDNLRDLIYFRDKIDFYNPELNENTTYEIYTLPLKNNNREDYLKYGGYCKTVARCVRTNKEFSFFHFYNIEDLYFQKIGQYPSIADYDISQIKKYNKVLDKDTLKEFTKAIGLAANGVGIGSFVYLRRIFEKLIEEAHGKAKITENWNEQDYKTLRMADKIQILQDYLPAFLVENKSLYSILSVGIHELEEQKCLEYFAAVKVGIELILDEKIEQYEKAKKIADAKQKIATITQQIKK